MCLLRKDGQKRIGIYCLYCMHTEFLCSVLFTRSVDVSFRSTHFHTHAVTCMLPYCVRWSNGTNICVCVFYTSISRPSLFAEENGCSSVNRTQIELLWDVCVFRESCIFEQNRRREEKRDIWKSSGREKKKIFTLIACLFLSPLFRWFAKKKKEKEVHTHRYVFEVLTIETLGRRLAVER